MVTCDVAMLRARACGCVGVRGMVRRLWWVHSWQECRGAAHLHLLPLPLLCPDPRRLDTVLHFLFPIFPLLVFLFSNCVYTHIYIYISFFFLFHWCGLACDSLLFRFPSCFIILFFDTLSFSVNVFGQM